MKKTYVSPELSQVSVNPVDAITASIGSDNEIDMGQNGGFF